MQHKHAAFCVTLNTRDLTKRKSHVVAVITYMGREVCSRCCLVYLTPEVMWKQEEPCHDIAMAMKWSYLQSDGRSNGTVECNKINKL